MKFLLPVIEIFCHKLKYLNNPMEFLKFFSYSGRAYRTLEGTPTWPWHLGGLVKCGPYNAPLRRYKALKNEISITGNRKISRKF